jgi:hypothetical protein
MTLVNSARLPGLVRRALGLRGPYFLDAGTVISPVYDVGSIYEPALDDGAIYWAFVAVTAAVAGNFSFATIAPFSGRASLDGLLVGSVTVASIVRVSKAPGTTAGGAVVVIQPAAANPQENSAPNPQTSSSLQVFTGTQVADPLAGNVVANFPIATVGGPPFHFRQRIGFNRGEQLIIAPSIQNAGFNVSLFGRIFPNFPE